MDYRPAQRVLLSGRSRIAFGQSAKEPAGRGRCTRQSMQSSRKDRALLPAPRPAGSFALWPNAIWLRPERALVALGDNPLAGATP